MAEATSCLFVAGIFQDYHMINPTPGDKVRLEMNFTSGRVRLKSNFWSLGIQAFLLIPVSSGVMQNIELIQIHFPDFG